MRSFDHGVKSIVNNLSGDRPDVNRHVVQVVKETGLDVAACGASAQFPCGVSDFGKGGSLLRRYEDSLHLSDVIRVNDRADAPVTSELNSSCRLADARNPVHDVKHDITRCHIGTSYYTPLPGQAPLPLGSPGGSPDRCSCRREPGHPC